MAHLEVGKKIKPKSKCCKDNPRCKKCPVVLKRLAREGYAERRQNGRYVVIAIVPKKAVKAARAR